MSRRWLPNVGLTLAAEAAVRTAATLVRLSPLDDSVSEAVKEKKMIKKKKKK